MSNLLEKASIVTTPTAYDNGKILSVKPSVVLGDELITNGDFSDGTNDWSVANGTISIDNDRLKIDGNSGATAEQTVTAIIGKTYKVTYNFTLGNATSGALIITGGNYPTLNAPQGVNTFYTTATQTNLRIRPRLGSTGTMFIDNISVKEAIDGDFDFTRNSSATRVNSQGLIEDMQILSSNLVSNGDFSQEGSEEVTNGNFATNTDWTIDGGNAQISNGKLNLTNAVIYGTSVKNSATVVSGKTYLVKYTISDYVGGSSQIRLGSRFGTSRNSNGSFSEYIVANDTNIRIYSSSINTTLSIDNVSVKEVGQDWALGTGWSIGDGVAERLVATSSSDLVQASVFPNLTSTFRISFDIDATAGSVRARLGQTNLNYVGQGTHTFYAIPSGNDQLKFQADSNFIGSITNISVIEITDDTNLPRIDYTGGTGHWLFEPQSTNLVLNSNSGLGSTNMNLVYNNATSPDGTQNAYKSTTTTASIAHVRTLNVTFANTSTFSVFLKYGNNQWYQILSAVKTGNFVNVDIQNGVFGTNGADTENLSIKDFGNGWYRVSGTFINAAGTSTLRIYTGSSSSSPWASTSAPIGSYNYGYGFQVEASSFATSYIPTEGAIKTRLQDAAFGAGSSDLINSTEGVLYAEIAALGTGTYKLISLNNGAANNSVTIGFNNGTSNFYFRVLASNGNATFQSFPIDYDGFNKIALKYKSGDISVFANGTKKAQSNATFAFASSLDKLNFDYGSGGALPFYGKTKCVAVFKEALTDAELTCLTTI